jgi:hypothetical protein
MMVHATGRPTRRALVLVLLAVLLGACSSSSPATVSAPAGQTGPTSAGGGVPVINSFTADPPEIGPGASAVLAWDVDDTTTVQIAPDVGEAIGSSAVVQPAATTTYTLTATNAAGSATATVTVSVTDTVTNVGPGLVTAPVTSAALGSADDWVNATGNLAGMTSECGDLSMVNARPDDGVVMAGVARKGLWANTDPSTDTWTPLGTGPGSATITNRASSFQYDPDHPGTWYMSGTYNGGGVYKTTDNGVTFTQLGDVSHVDYVSVDFGDPARQTMLVGIHEQTQVQRSTDGGATWSQMSNLPLDIGFTTAPVIIDQQTYLLGTNNGNKAGIYRSTDAGASWTEVVPGGVAGQPLFATDGTIYWVVGHDLVASGDKGATWTTRATNAFSNGSLIELEDGRLVGVMGERLGVSSDKGATWTAFGPRLPYDPWGLAYSSHRRQFFIWHFQCLFDRPDTVLPDAIMRLDLS